MTSLPYGLRDVKITPISAAGVLGTALDLPNGRTFSFEEGEDFEELRGDDKVVAVRGQGATVSWELESGGIDLEVYASRSLRKRRSGRATVVESGVTPNVVKTLTKLGVDAKPRFQVEGQAISESGGDFHVVLPNCKATESLSGELADGAFWLSSASGTAIADPTSDVVFEFVENETATAIS